MIASRMGLPRELVRPRQSWSLTVLDAGSRDRPAGCWGDPIAFPGASQLTCSIPVADLDRLDP